MRISATAVCCLLGVFPQLFAAQPPETDPVPINWKLASGVPLRVYLTKRLTKRVGEPVHARTLEPIFSFNHEIIPAGAEVTGHISKLNPVTKFQRFGALLGGDFTPLHDAEVEFTSVTLADGRQVPFRTVANAGLNSVYSAAKAKRAGAPKPAGGTGSQVKAQIASQIKTRTDSVADMVRAPDKMERAGEYFLMKLPYHPQWVRNGTRFDAPVIEPVDFGSGTLDRADLRLLGTQPSGDSTVHARLVTGATSGTAKPGDRIAAVVTQPLLSPENKLILPEGTHLMGTVTQAHAARWFHRGGQLRFSFDKMALPEGYPGQSSDENQQSPDENKQSPETKKQRPEAQPAAAQAQSTQIQAVVDSAEAGGAATLRVDAEGNVRAVESKTRFIMPAISVLIATRGGDHDSDRHDTSATGSNNSGRNVLGGGLGFGLLGTVAARSSKLTGVALGYYGLAWSVYRNIFARGAEVQFGKDAAMDIRFGSRAPLVPVQQ